MADVTDPAFRRIIAKYGKPDVTWTEFVSADGLFLSPIGEYCQKFIDDEISVKEFNKVIETGIAGSALLNDLAFDKIERPIVVQFFTSRPDMMEKAARLAVKLGFDGVDINMGCPDKSIEKQNAGAKLMTNPMLAKEIILAAKRGVQYYNTPKTVQGESLDNEGIPVSVKTRIGWNKNELETWLPVLLEANPAVITIHARTRKEQSLVPARWEHVKRAVEIRNCFVDSEGKKNNTLIFGNGDVTGLEDARQKAIETGCDGVMIGRAIFGNPWLFSPQGETFGTPRSSLGEKQIRLRLKVLVEHTKIYEKLLPHKSFAVMKKHYKAYVEGFDGAKELRMRLMECNNAGEVEKIVKKYPRKQILD